MISCPFQAFFGSILNSLPDITENRFLGPLSVYLLREYRLLAYSQFLEVCAVWCGGAVHSMICALRILSIWLYRFLCFAL
jgi:hypothetical protein